MSTTKAAHSYTHADPLKGIVYFKHPFTGKLALYIAYVLKPNRKYRFDVTEDGVTWSELTTKSTEGMTHDVYESFNVPDPGNGLWPRVIDLGPV